MAIETLQLKITAAGRAAAITQNGDGLELDITHISLGDGRYDSDATGAGMTDLKHRVETVPVDPGTVGTDSFNVVGTFPAAGTPYTATELGLWFGHPDVGGKLIAVWSSTLDARIVTVRSRLPYAATVSMTLNQAAAGSFTMTVDSGTSATRDIIELHTRKPDPHGQYLAIAADQWRAHQSGPTTGDGAAFDLAISPALPALVRFDRVALHLHAAAKSTAPTLNVSGTGAKPIKLYSVTGQKVAPRVEDLPAGILADFVFDGADWVMVTALPSSASAPFSASAVTSLPAFGGGTGSADNPFALAQSIGAPGTIGVKIATITVPGLPAGDFMPVADLNQTENGGRFAVTNHVVNGSGALVFDLMFSDSPVSAIGTISECRLKIGDAYIVHERTITTAVVTVAPSITSPVNGAAATPLAPSFTTSAYATSGGADTHKATDWEVASDPSFSLLAAASPGDSVNLTSWTAPADLAYGTTYYVRARHIGLNSGSGSYSPATSFATHARAVTTKPVITSPADGSAGNLASPAITTSAFGVSTGTDTHEGSTWQIATDAGFASVVATLDSAIALTSWTPSTPLAYSTTFYARVKHRGAQSGPSVWSDTVAFATSAASAIRQPAITSPTPGASGVLPPLTCAAFSVTVGSDTHVGSTWHLSTDPLFGSLAASTNNSATAKTQWTPTGLQPGATYYARVKHHGQTLPDSAFSPTVSFTALAVAKPVLSIAGGTSAVLAGATATGSAYTATGASAHQETDWELSAASNFSPLSAASSAADRANLTAWAIPAGLTPATTYYLRARYRSASGVVSGYSDALSFTTAATPTTVAPTLTAPAAGALATNPPTLRTGPYSGSAGAGAHHMTTWQVSTDPAFAVVQVEAANDTANLLAWTPGSALPAGTHYLRARHKGANTAWSDFSAPVTVTAAAAPVIERPAITSPTQDQAGFGGRITATAFTATGSADTHDRTNWQIATDEAFLSVVAASMDDAVNRVTLPFSALTGLTGGGTYFVRVQYRGTAIGWSLYSTPIRFKAVKVTKPTITSPKTATTGISRSAPITSSAFAADGTDTHAASEWLVSPNADFSAPIMTTTSAVDLVSTLMTGAAALTVYYAKVRHKGAAGGFSDWSAAVSFTTKGLISATTRKLNGSMSFGFQSGIAYGNGRFVSVGYNASGSVSGAGTAVVSASDYATQTVVSVPAIGMFCYVSFLAGKFIASARRSAAATYTVLTSPDGEVWTEATAINCRPTDFATDGAVIVGMAQSGNVITSTNGGATWTEGASITASASTTVRASFCYSQELDLFLCAAGATVYKSSDGIAWSAAYSVTGKTMDDVCWGNGTFIVSGSDTATGNAFVARSTDGATWTTSAPGYGRLNAVQIVDGLFYAAGRLSASSSNGYGVVIKSVDNGATWTTLASTGFGAMQSIAPDGGGTLAASGYNASGVTSAGGIVITP
ncbi:MAG: hypothetical protein RLZZ373_3181 [Pseudomonadota bacterium]